MNYPHVSIIILNWNNWRDTIECLESVYQTDYCNYKVIVVDNASENNSIEKIKNYCEGNLTISSNFFDYNYHNKPIDILEIKNINKMKLSNYFTLKKITNRNLILIENDENYGYTEGNNIGIQFVVNHLKSDYILLLNNDTVVNNQLLKNMVNMSEKDEKVVLAQPKLLYYYEPNIINSTGNKMDLFGCTYCRGIGELDTGSFDKLIDKGFFYVSGACMLVKKDFLSEFIEYNLFDSMLFAYHEDVDVGFMAHILGFKLLYCPDAVCYHKENSSLNDNYQRDYWVLRNNLRVLLKNYSLKTLLIIYPTTLVIELVFAVISTLYQKKLEYLNIYIKSIFWNIKIIHDTLEKRKIVQSKRNLNDTDLFKFVEKKSLKLSLNYRYFIKKYFKKF